MLKGRWTRELAFALLVFLAYSAVNVASRGRRDVAIENAEAVIALERRAGIFIEPELQGMILGTGLEYFVSAFYMFVHPLATLAFLSALLLLEDPHYPKVRNVFVAFCLSCFLVFLLYPSAPPRMMEEYGFVDVLGERSPVNYETALVGEILNPYASMPSVHFGLCLIVSGGLVIAVRRGAAVVAAASYAVLMLFTVICSGNHLILDCLVATVMLAAVALVLERAAAGDGLARYLRR
jgi:hypothetical protein